MSMERLFALLAAAAAVPSAQIGPTLQQPPAATAPAAPTPADQLAFTEEQLRMTVPVQISGAGPYHFLIDTGAQRSIVSHQLATRLGLSPGRRVRLIDMAGASEVNTVIVPSLVVSTPPIAGLGGEQIEAPALDANNLGAAGMLGIDSLQDHALSIDFDNDTMAVVPARKRFVHEGKHGDDIIIRARSLFGQLVVTDAKVNGRRVRVVLDTGTAISLGNTALQRLLARGSRRDPVTFTSVMGRTLTAQMRPIGTLTLGEATISDLPIAFADAAPFRAFGLADRPALLLGMDALRLFRRVDIDFANRELRLKLPRNARTAAL